MQAPPLLPRNLSSQSIACSVRSSKPYNTVIQTKKNRKTSTQIQYQKPNWEQRIETDWHYFSNTKSIGKITVIDISQHGDELAYRYLSNGAQNQHYEPWSSSKIFAYTAAIAKARQQGLGANSTVGKYHIADLITAIHTYEGFGSAPGDSNAIATWLANIAGRDYISRLMHKSWLNLADAHIFFRGAYATNALKPGSHVWRDKASNKTVSLENFANSRDDPGYLPYHCTTCAKTGNKPMTTLMQAEWLKRLATHQRDTLTQHPDLQSEDIEVLFYGKGHTDQNHHIGGMMQGISRMLSHAIARQISGNPDVVHDQAKLILDKATQGQWRIFQKIGGGPSETRGSGESVILAHVCLPHYQGGREFTIAAQASHPGNDEMDIARSGLKMQKLLDLSMLTLLNNKDKP